MVVSLLLVVSVDVVSIGVVIVSLLLEVLDGVVVGVIDVSDVSDPVDDELELGILVSVVSGGALIVE